MSLTLKGIQKGNIKKRNIKRYSSGVQLDN